MTRKSENYKPQAAMEWSEVETLLTPETHPLEMTNGELGQTFGKLKNSVLMRSLLMAEVNAIRAGAKRETRTMRNMWYDYLKPVLSRLGLLNNKTRNGKDVDWDGILSKYLAELVNDGLTSYAELKIVDGSRQRQVACEVTRGIYDVSIVGGRFPWLILFTEKDTMWNEIQNLASLYGCSAISGGGEPSYACTENIITEILDTMIVTKSERPITLLSLTDYDPSGYIIAEAQAEQIRKVVKGLVYVEHRRIGLFPEQLTPVEKQAKSYTPKDRGLDEWLAMTNGVDGQPLGLELDALPLSRLREIFATGIEKCADLGKLKGDLRNAFVELTAWKSIKSEVDTMFASAKAKVTIANEVLPDDLFHCAAVSGWDSINPMTAQYEGRPIFSKSEGVKC